MKAEVKAEWNFEQSFIKSNKIGNRCSYSGSTDYTSLLVIKSMYWICRCFALDGIVLYWVVKQALFYRSKIAQALYKTC